MFGPSDKDSPNSAELIRWRVKRDTNDTLRQRFVDLTVPQARAVGLTLPDPDILTRAFVAVPLCEIAPELLLPGLGVPIREVADRLPKKSMQPLSEFTRTLQNEFQVAKTP